MAAAYVVIVHDNSQCQLSRVDESQGRSLSIDYSEGFFFKLRVKVDCSALQSRSLVQGYSAPWCGISLTSLSRSSRCSSGHPWSVTMVSSLSSLFVSMVTSVTFVFVSMVTFTSLPVVFFLTWLSCYMFLILQWLPFLFWHYYICFSAIKHMFMTRSVP